MAAVKEETHTHDEDMVLSYRTLLVEEESGSDTEEEMEGKSTVTGTSLRQFLEQSTASVPHMERSHSVDTTKSGSQLKLPPTLNHSLSSSSLTELPQMANSVRLPDVLSRSGYFSSDLIRSGEAVAKPTPTYASPRGVVGEGVVDRELLRSQEQERRKIRSPRVKKSPMKDIPCSSDCLAAAPPLKSTPSKGPATPLQDNAWFGVKNWNEEFQSLLVKLKEVYCQQGVSNSGDALFVGGNPFQGSVNTDAGFRGSISNLSTTSAVQRNVDQLEALSSLASDFAYCAKSYGKIIISEMHLPPHLKTIKPIPVGGIAGGTKFLVQGILFKFATDHYSLYGGEENSAKAAAAELRGMSALFNCKIEGLEVPLMALIDYLGYRLIAIALLPINRETLVYGSSNGGKTVFNSDKRMTALMAEVGEKLHLRKHTVRPFSSRNGNAAVELHGPVDIEGHVGLDNRFYVVDAARLLPCEAPAKAYNGTGEKNKGEHLYKLLRPEFLRMMPSLGLPRLSSDAFSSFSVPEERVEVENDILEATRVLYDRLVPSYASLLSSLKGIDKLRNAVEPDRLHRAGLPLRALGRVRAAIAPQHQSARKIVMCAVLVRVLKNILRHKLRLKMQEERIASLEPYLRVCRNFFNFLINSSGEKSSQERFWCIKIKDEIESRFPGTLSENELRPAFNLQYYIRSEIVPLMTKFQDITGVRLNAKAQSQFESLEDVLESGFTVLRPDINDMLIKVKQLNIIYQAQGSALLLRASLATDEEAERLFDLANESLELALRTSPEGIETLLDWGDLLRNHAVTNSNTASKHLLKHSLDKYRAILKMVPTHTLAQLGHALSLSCLAGIKLEEAEGKGESEASHRLLRKAKDMYAQCLCDFAAAMMAAPASVHTRIEQVIAKGGPFLANVLRACTEDSHAADALAEAEKMRGEEGQGVTLFLEQVLAVVSVTQRISLRGSSAITTERILRFILPHCGRLRSLNLSGCAEVSDATLQLIQEHLKSVEQLDLFGCPAITSTAIEALCIARGYTAAPKTPSKRMVMSDDENAEQSDEEFAPYRSLSSSVSRVAAPVAAPVEMEAEPEEGKNLRKVSLPYETSDTHRWNDYVLFVKQLKLRFPRMKFVVEEEEQGEQSKRSAAKTESLMETKKMRQELAHISWKMKALGLSSAADVLSASSVTVADELLQRTATELLLLNKGTSKSSRKSSFAELSPVLQKQRLLALSKRPSEEMDRRHAEVVIPFLYSKVDVDLRVWAAVCLGKIGADCVVQPLLERAADEKDRFVREAICIALSRLQSPESISVLQKMYRNDPISDVRTVAGLALRRIGGKEVEQFFSSAAIVREQMEQLIQESLND